MIGKLSEKTLEALLETLPLEFSILDENDKVLAWNRHNTRIFKRPENVLGRDVRNCHPHKSLAKVELILAEMKKGARDMAEFWIDLQLDPAGPKSKVLIQYFALRDQTGKYLGCVECTQNISPIQALSGEKRLLD